MINSNFVSPERAKAEVDEMLRRRHEVERQLIARQRQEAYEGCRGKTANQDDDVLGGGMMLDEHDIFGSDHVDDDIDDLSSDAEQERPQRPGQSREEEDDDEE